MENQYHAVNRDEIHYEFNQRTHTNQRKNRTIHIINRHKISDINSCQVNQVHGENVQNSQQQSDRKS